MMIRSDSHSYSQSAAGKESRTWNPTPRVTSKRERVIFRASAGAILNPFLSPEVLCPRLSLADRTVVQLKSYRFPSTGPATV
ncbi:hypothetical protein CEXT_347921 [Caerostris extrusa]|uniref:Uncharacterized protein n=1 Tax=Caerostris extrusa TaxID=172846 RepID=A0AAV4RYM4_CAEEX|nr:hypothetical protein CEXT_347921 [Caerostris extrusa]